MGDSPVSERLPDEVTVRQRVAVVGAGPAGVVTVAVLLSRGATVDWVDRQFLPAGGMGGWKEVPANTKVRPSSNFHREGLRGIVGNMSSDGKGSTTSKVSEGRFPPRLASRATGRPPGAGYHVYPWGGALARSPGNLRHEACDGPNGQRTLGLGASGSPSKRYAPPS
jgi:hypothetical protein